MELIGFIFGLGEAIWLAFTETPITKWYLFPFFIFVSIIYGGLFIYLPLYLIFFIIIGVLKRLGILPQRLQKYFEQKREQEVETIVSHFGTCMQKFSVSVFYDEKNLSPYSKEEIYKALIESYSTKHSENKMIVNLEAAFIQLPFFQKGVGEKPVYTNIADYFFSQGIKNLPTDDMQFSKGLIEEYFSYEARNHDRLMTLKKLCKIETDRNLELLAKLSANKIGATK